MEKLKIKHEKGVIYDTAIYIRVSTNEKSTNGVSTEVQKESILKYINTNSDKFRINKRKHIYIDNGFSGATDKRPGLIEMFEAAKNKEFSVIIIWAIDRFFRKNKLLLNYFDELLESGVMLKSYTQDLDFYGPNGGLLLSIFGSMAESERHTIRLRTIMGKQGKADDNYYVGGNPPFGYDAIIKGKGNILVENKEESEIVRRIFDLYGNQNKTAGEIRQILSAEGILTKHDKLIREKGKGRPRKYGEGQWHIGTVIGILKKTQYIGKYYYGVSSRVYDEVLGKRVYKKNDPTEWLEMTCIPLIDEELFYRVQEKIEMNKKTRNNPVSHLFAGLIRCKCCGRYYVGYRSSKGTINYRCSGTLKQKILDGKKCENSQISEIIIKEALGNIADKLFKDTESLLEDYYDCKTQNSKKLKQLQEEEKGLSKKINEVELALTNAYETLFMAEISKRKYIETSISNFEEKIKVMKARLGEIVSKIATYNDIENSKKSIKILTKKYKDSYMNFTLEEKVAIIKDFIDKIEIKGEDVEVNLKFPMINRNNGRNREQGKLKKVIDYSKELGNKLLSSSESIINEKYINDYVDRFVYMDFNIKKRDFLSY